MSIIERITLAVVEYEITKYDVPETGDWIQKGRVPGKFAVVDADIPQAVRDWIESKRER